MPEMIEDALSLMLAGMGTVFFFLAVLVISIVVVSKLVQVLSTPKEGNRVKAPVAANQLEHYQRIAAVAAAAFAQHQQQNSKN